MQMKRKLSANIMSLGTPSRKLFFASFASSIEDLTASIAFPASRSRCILWVIMFFEFFFQIFRDAQLF